ncbi:OLC1v1019031C1 [Oldenlandia corymbosa var. corymbosa]|uniref:OLC1v1019031C1 n=1 Tax=Oldenlandia corymbosa var. corymbosa TaxID=529605 RepID=A0AAV1ED56_OLDCO|nr:OLC1v1019031C1 [Oldenlandia corymbosa var. corymbosa]
MASSCSSSSSSLAALKSNKFLIPSHFRSQPQFQYGYRMSSLPIPFKGPTTTPSSSSVVLRIRRKGRNACLISRVKAQSSTSTTDFVPEANFYKVEAILRPWRVPQVSSALLRMGIRGVTISDVRGFGAQGGLTERQAGSEFAEDNFVAKVKMEIVVSKDQVDAVIEKIIEEARTGEIGDGKIFVIPVADVIRVRTGERGEKAERMKGGRADMISAASPLA